MMDNVADDVNKFNVSALSLSDEDKFGKGSNNYTKYGATEHLGGEVTANSTLEIKGKNVKNRKGSEWITHVTNPSNPEAFKAAKKGSVFVEFDIDKNIIKPGGKEN